MFVIVNFLLITNPEYQSTSTRWSSLSSEYRSVPMCCIGTVSAIGVSFGGFLGCAGRNSWQGLQLLIIFIMSPVICGQ